MAIMGHVVNGGMTLDKGRRNMRLKAQPFPRLSFIGNGSLLLQGPFALALSPGLRSVEQLIAKFEWGSASQYDIVAAIGGGKPLVTL
jgi:hypothetical protein